MRYYWFVHCLSRASDDLHPALHCLLSLVPKRRLMIDWMEEDLNRKHSRVARHAKGQSSLNSVDEWQLVEAPGGRLRGLKFDLPFFADNNSTAAIDGQGQASLPIKLNALAG